MSIACFNLSTGDVEDAPAPNALNTYEIVEKDGAVYVRGEEAAIKSGQRNPRYQCSVVSPERVVVIGGYVFFFFFPYTLEKRGKSRR
jgi:hypothetical protein